MDIGRSFTYMFEDPNWIAKLAIGGGILLAGTFLSFVLGLPLLAATALVLGYSLTVTRNVAEGSPTPLPDWNDFGTLFVKGLTAIVGVIIWALPVILVVCCLALVNVVLGRAASSDTQGARAASGVAAVASACLYCILFLLALVVNVTVHAPLTRFALNGQLSTFWDFGGNWRFIQANIGNYIIAVLLLLVANLIAGLGVIACFVGIFFTTFWANLVGAHLFGQVARGAPASTDVTPMTPLSPPPLQPAAPS